jgi:hypothetical protein
VVGDEERALGGGDPGRTAREEVAGSTPGRPRAGTAERGRSRRMAAKAAGSLSFLLLPSSPLLVIPSCADCDSVVRRGNNFLQKLHVPASATGTLVTVVFD